MENASSGSKQGQTPATRFTSELCLWQGFFLRDETSLSGILQTSKNRPEGRC
ncbi:hypothetical protein SynBIOSU31_03274 [Synechococcus sp. BIOS-U3-1]|nr:hypothetical protein SynBIOSU31_03274 [Synechococcus sp. BIOS-U3-1]